VGIQDRKTREHEQLRQSILDAALRVLAEEGYGRVSMRKIASLIEYSPTTIYRFFRNKEELLRAIAGRTYADLSARFERARAEQGSDPLALLRTCVREYMTYCVAHAEMYRLLSDLACFEVENGVVYERVGETRARVYQSWLECIGQAIARGAFAVRDEMRVFLFVWDAVSGYIDHRIGHPGIPREPIDEDAAEFVNLVFRALEARAEG